MDEFFIGLIVFGFVAFFAIVGFASVNRNEIIECHQWQEDAAKYSEFYLVQWQADQCKAHSIIVNAPIR